MPTGPAGIEYAKVEAMEGKSPMMLKEMPKTSIMVKLRRNSCLYPIPAVSQHQYALAFNRRIGR